MIEGGTFASSVCANGPMSMYGNSFSMCNFSQEIPSAKCWIYPRWVCIGYLYLSLGNAPKDKLGHQICFLLTGRLLNQEQCSFRLKLQEPE